MKKRIVTASIAGGLAMVMSPLSAEVMIGAFVPENGWNQQAITDLNDSLPKSMAFVNVFSSFYESWDHLYWQSSKIVDEGMTPMISWMPIDLSRYDDNILPEILLGTWDPYIDEWGDDLIAWVNSYPEDNRPSILLRFGHEFNGNWYSYANHPVWYKQAWQYIHDRFESAGVNQHLEWVWNANNVSVDAYDDITQYYPGDNYVDWTSIDGYNWGTNYTWTSWDSFTDVFSATYGTLVTNYPDKPIIIAEVGSADPADQPDPSWGQNGDNSDFHEDKDSWHADMLSTIEADFPAIRAVALFNIDKELSWSLTEPASTGLTGFNQGLQSGHYTSEFLALETGAFSFNSPEAGQALTGAEQTFSWNQQRESWLYVGSSPGGRQHVDTGNGGITDSITVTGLPVDGSTVFVRLWYRETPGSGQWMYIDEQFTAADESAVTMLTPLPGATLAGADQYFSWTPQNENWLYLGTSPGAKNIYDSGNIATTSAVNVSGLPVNGAAIHATLWYRETPGTGQWQSARLSFTAANTSAMLIPAAESISTVADTGKQLPRAVPQVTFEEVPHTRSDDLQWADQFIAQVAALPESLLNGAAVTVVGSGKSVKDEVKELKQSKKDIEALEELERQLLQTGTEKELKKVQNDLAKARSKYSATNERLERTKENVSSMQSNPTKKIKRKKIDKTKQRELARSKALPPVNVTKRDRARNGFKSMTQAQRDSFKARKRSVLD